MDKFFTQTHCDRCGGSMEGGRKMSMFNMDCCMECIGKERRRKDYREAQEAERAALLRGERNFEGIGF